MFFRAVKICRHPCEGNSGLSGSTVYFDLSPKLNFHLCCPEMHDDWNGPASNADNCKPDTERDVRLQPEYRNVFQRSPV